MAGEVARIDFVIPFRARTTTTNWRRACQLLTDTLRSVENSSDARWRAIVVCHDEPIGIPSDRQVLVVRAPFEPPGPDSQNLATKRRLFVWETDKGRKQLAGVDLVRRSGSKYFMLLDADDLISSRLVEWCLARDHPAGYFIDEGYRLDDTNRDRLYFRRRFFQECGSSSILRTTVAPFPAKLDYTLDLNDKFTRRYVVHAYIPEAMAALGQPMERVPFPAAVYRFHDQNIFANSARKKESWLRRQFRNLLRGRLLDCRLRSEFSIPDARGQGE